ATGGHDVVADKAAHGYDTNGNCVCGAHQHTYSTTWTYDGANHWNAVTCGHAVDVANKAAHNFGNDRTCDTCGYTYSSGDNPGNPGGTNPGGGGVGGGGSAAKPEGPVGGGGGGGSDDEEGMVLGAEEVAAVNFLNTTDHIVYMVGDDKGNFRPEASVTRAEVAQIFYNLLINKDVPITATFADVPENQWYAKAVNTLASMGILSGVGDNMYEPTRMITRAEFAVIAAKFVDAVQADSNFADVPESHWAYGSISTAATYGWIAGVGDNMYAPSRAIKRVEAATIVNNMLGRMGDHDKIDAGLCRQFPDVSETHWGRYQIAEATTDHDYSFDEYRTIETWID
ncbi:MAG: S-layer homology domain-containing protein, partial [Anaerotignum sp.]|nr:S-layer homology domain-containing protein [Anaerotignum sp.]